MFDAKDHPPVPPDAEHSDRTVLFGADGRSGDDDEDGDATRIRGDRDKK